jgi:hypothetical protein
MDTFRPAVEGPDVDGPFSFADWATRAEIEATRLAREPPSAI